METLVDVKAVVARREELLRSLGGVAAELVELAHREGELRAGQRELPSTAALEAARFVDLVERFSSVPFRR